MGAPETDHSLSLEELERLLQERRRPLVAERMQHIALTEEQLREQVQDDAGSKPMRTRLRTRLQTPMRTHLRPQGHMHQPSAGDGRSTLGQLRFEPLDKERPKDRFSRLWNRFLLLLELGAVVAFVVLGARGLRQLQRLNAEMRSVQMASRVSPTATALPDPVESHRQTSHAGSWSPPALGDRQARHRCRRGGGR